MSSKPAPGERFTSFEAFYPHYLDEHSDPTCRRIHVLGTSSMIAAAVLGLVLSPWWLLAVPVLGFGSAWIAHAVFQKNRPTATAYFLWSVAGDLRLLFETLTGKRRF